MVVDYGIWSVISLVHLGHKLLRVRSNVCIMDFMIYDPMCWEETVMLLMCTFYSDTYQNVGVSFGNVKGYLLIVLYFADVINNNTLYCTLYNEHIIYCNIQGSVISV